MPSAPSPDSAAASEAAPGTRQRPRDRKQQILTAARDLFVERGYPQVTMAQIAERVGITAGALYRHFATKAVLLEQVVTDNFAWLDQPVSGQEYADVVDEVIGRVADKPYLSDLWIHESRYLPEKSHRELRRRMRAWNQSLTPALRHRRPDLDEGQEELLAWAMQSLMSCVGRQAMHTAMPVRLPAIRGAFHAITTAELVPTGEPVQPAPALLTPVSMRERLLTAAFTQFGSRGYQDTSMASIGAAADVTGPNLYGYFESKADLLRAVLERSTHALWLGVDDALATSASPEDALRKLATSYIAVSRSYAGVLEDPTREYPVEDSATATQREYLAEWVALLRQHSPDLGDRPARVRVQLLLFLVADLHRNPRISRTSSFRQNLESLALAVLFDGAPAER